MRHQDSEFWESKHISGLIEKKENKDEIKAFVDQKLAKNSEILYIGLKHKLTVKRDSVKTLRLLNSNLKKKYIRKQGTFKKVLKGE